MSLKSYYKHIILWGATLLAGMLTFALIIVPPMINLNNLKPKIQETIYQQTGVPATIGGDINISLLGRATIVAHDVTIPMGKIKHVAFAVPLRHIFNLSTAPLTGDISIHGGNFKIDTLQQFPLNHDLDIYNTTVNFLDKDYYIVRAHLAHGGLNGTIRTDQHKYELEFSDNEFTIKNRNDNLEIVGQLYPDGTARGRISIATRDINRWFQFSQPRITIPIEMVATFDWDGGYGVKFLDISANQNVTGNIELYPDGSRNIQLRGTDLDYNLSFLLHPNNLIRNTKFDLDFYGELELGEYKFTHMRILATGTDDALYLDNIVADNIHISGGTINATGAKSVLIKTIFDGFPATCLFSGNATNWSCQTFTWGNIAGTISINKDHFDLSVISPNPMPDTETLVSNATRFAKYGHLDFQFSDMAGTLDIDKRGITTKYKYVANKTLGWLKSDFAYIPEFMKNTPGNFLWRGDVMDFNPDNNHWFLSIGHNRFFLTGTNIKDLFPDLDLQSLKDAEYTITGTYNKNNISDLSVQIAGQQFTGTINNRDINLKTPILNLDAFINEDFVKNYEELSFFINSPLTIPFDLNTKVYISADKVIYKNNEYANFVYALKPNVQTFSISDNARGNMLVIIEKAKSQYDISVQMNKFVIPGELLPHDAPLNLYNTTVTADISLFTHGMIAHDLEYNLTGELDLIFDGGYIMGLGLDKFYSSAENITRFNAEYALSDAFDGGETRLKSLRIIGEYKNGNFRTVAPLMLQMRHTDATGRLDITDGQMSAQLDLTMRGTSPSPITVALDIAPTNTRHYSLSDIMRELDVSFMRTFIKTHTRF